MKFMTLSSLIVCTLVVCSATFAFSTIPDYSNCCATMPNAVAGSLALFNLPNGEGSSFTEAQLISDGSVVDATIEFFVIDIFDDPVVGFPAEDMWLASVGGGMIPCVGGTTAGQETDETGFTTWVNPLRAGGFDSGVCDVFINGEVITCGDVPFNLAFNSADISGDGVVNLADVGLFTAILFGTYDFSADFFADGVMNLADVGRMALGVGTSCP